MSAKTKFPRAAALEVARELCRALKPVCGPDRLIVAGSLRRRKEEVGDVELVFVPRHGEVQDGLFAKAGDLANAAINQLVAAGVLTHRLSSAGLPAWGAMNKLAVHAASGIPVDLFSTHEEFFFNYLVCRTGSKETNTLIAIKAQERGLKWLPTREGFEIKELDKVLDTFAHTEGLLPAHVHTGAVIPAKSERAVFELAGLAYREPWER